MLVRFSFYFSWLLGFCLLLILPIFFPFVKIGYFVPFSILLIYKSSFYKTIFGAFFAGFVLDCFTNSPLLGADAFIYTLTAATLFPLKKHLFEEKVLTLPLMAYLFTGLMTIYHFLFYLFIGLPSKITLEILIKELFLFPLVEFIYAFLLLTIPLRWIPQFKRYLREQRAE